MKNEKNDDLQTLSIELSKEGIKHEIRRHPGAEPRLLEVIGYYPTGEWQILIKLPVGKLSVIRGYASFGMIEAMGVSDAILLANDPERWNTEKEFIDWLKPHLAVK